MGELVLLTFLAIGLLAVGKLGWNVHERRRALDAASGDTCLLCDSHEVETIDATDYRCTTCGFDSTQTPRFARQLERFRDVKNAAWEVDQALLKIRKAPKAGLLSPDAARQLIHEATTHQSEAFRYLTDLVRQNPRLLDVSIAPRVTATAVMTEAKLVELARHLDSIADSLRAQILEPVGHDPFDAMLADLVTRVAASVSQHIPEGGVVALTAYELPPRPRPVPRN